VLVHRRTLPALEMATPTDEVVAKLEMIRDRMTHPPRVYPRFRKQVAVVAPQDSLEQVMRLVAKSGFSQFPVMDGDEFVGLLTENGITRWLACKIVTSLSLVDFADARVRDLVGNEERRKNFLFVDRKMAMVEVKEKFRSNGLLEAALITEKGQAGEKLLGLINRWDLTEE
jgi:predicted transcriptional regulator